MVTLILKRTTFYSPGDETAMFEWLARMPNVKRVRGVADSLHIHVLSNPSRAGMKELLALFYRYRGAMAQFAHFPALASTPLPGNLRSRSAAFTWWFMRFSEARLGLTPLSQRAKGRRKRASPAEA